MPTICEVCENQEFQLMDGLYYCTKCGLESERDLAIDITGQGFELSSSLIINSQEDIQNIQEKVQDLEVQWLTVEAYQCSLKAHINVFIELGYSMELDHVCKQVWFLYLDTYNYVKAKHFDNDVEAKHLESWRYRHLFINKFKDKGLYMPSGCVEKCVNSIIKYKKARRKSDAKKKRMDSDSDAYTTAGSESGFTSGESEDEDETEFVRNTIKSHTKRTKLRNKRQHFQNDYLNMLNIPVFCYLSLHMLHNDITPGDIINLIKMGILPYMYTHKILPKHMILSYYDVREFGCGTPPNYKQFVVKAHLLALKMNLPLFDANIPLLVCRYLHELNLPLALLPICKSLANEVPYKRCNHKITHLTATSVETEDMYLPDLFAIALIIVAIKIVLCLNDITEYQKFDRCEKHQHCHIFSFCEWIEYHRQEKLRKMKFYNVLDSLTDPHLTENTSNTINTFLDNPASSKVIDPDLSYTMYKKQYVMRKNLSKAILKVIENKEFHGNEDNTEDVKNSSKYNFLLCCLEPHLEKAKKHCEYVIYVKLMGPSFDYSVKTSEPQLYSESYKYILNLASELTCAPPVMIQEIIRYIEKLTILPKLSPNSNHRQDDVYWQKFFQFMAAV